MTIRTVALALALACSFTSSIEAKRHKIISVKHAVKARKVHRQKIRPQKLRKTPK
jgi:hypothetical protein